MNHREKLMPDLHQVCNSLDQFIQHVAPVLENSSHFEPILEEARLKLIYMLSHTATSVFIARNNIEAFASAIILGRSVFEVGIKLYWSLSPDEPNEREQRRLRLLKQVSDYNRKIGDDIRAYIPSDADRHSLLSLQIDEYIKAHSQDGKRHTPDFKEIVSKIGDGKLYVPYRKSSQYVHGSHIYLLTERLEHSSHELFEKQDIHIVWWEALFLCWMGIVTSFGAYTRLVDQEFDELINLIQTINSDFDRLRTGNNDNEIDEDTL